MDFETTSALHESKGQFADGGIARAPPMANGARSMPEAEVTVSSLSIGIARGTKET